NIQEIYMKKIAYIEMDTHAEIALNFNELMKSSERFQVDCYFSEKILKFLNMEPSTSVFKVSPHDLFCQLEGKKYDLIIIGTAHRYFNIFLKITQHFPTAIIAHNLNFIKASGWTLLRNVFKKDVLFRLKLLLKERLLSKNQVYENAKFLFVLDKNLVNFCPKSIHLPLFFYNEIENAENENFTIVISGEVSQKRRDYKSIIQEIKSIKINKNFNFVFLGKAKGEELRWLENLHRELPKNVKIKFFKERVSTCDFNDELKKANVLWCPIQLETEFFSIKEIYGKTKMSGNIGDAIKYGKWAVFPKNYPAEYFFITKYQRDIDLFISKLPENDKNQWQNFSKEKVASELEKIFLNLWS
ncbi:MAG: hypothetical protein Q4A00_07260, partial [Flavobacteriaceae bacterium]|nr:hypothetical protein [Flavobacteriaceae bacterium]